MKKNNTAVKTILEAKEIAKHLKKGTEKSLQSILNEAISNAINESEFDEEDGDDDADDVEDTDSEDSYDVEDVDDEESSDDEGFDNEDEEGGESDDDEWSDEEKYKVGDNEYDFTEADADEVLKVYNKLDDSDKIFVKKEDDGTYTMTDEDNGTEYVIELDSDGFDGADDVDDFDSEDNDEEMEFEVDMDSDDDDDFDSEDDDEDVEFEVDMDSDDDDDELFEDIEPTGGSLKQVMTLPSNKEVANPSATYSMDDGVDKGDGRRYGKKIGNGKPFGKLNEMGDMDVNAENPTTLEEDGTGFNTKRSTKKTSRGIHKSGPYGTRHHSDNGNYQELVNENVKKVINKAKQIQAENKQYKNAIKQIKQSLFEAAVLNVSLGQVVRLLSENTTTAAEKKSIVERFNSVKTIDESKSLYNTIKRELNENHKSSTVMLEQQISANPSKVINETTLYKSESNPALELMNRMENLYKW